MRLATLADGSRDGALIVVDGSGSRFAPAGHIARNLQQALDEWPRCEPRLRDLEQELEGRRVEGEALAFEMLLAPLPRAYEWVDGSAYLSHILLARKARGAQPPEDLQTNPLVYQGGSGVLLGPRQPLGLPDPDFGLDFEGEIAVVLGDVPRGTRAEDAARHVRLMMLANDVTYRELVPPELKKGFGFFVSKPATSFGPFAVTPDELGGAFRDGRPFLRLSSTYNGTRVGDIETGPEMHFSFFDLVAHISRTRSFVAGTILGSGTVSSHDPERGASCLVERRMREIVANGAALTPYMKVGDIVRLEAFDSGGRSIFGAIEQKVAAA